MLTRPAAVAGRFYPAQPQQLRAAVEACLREADAFAQAAGLPEVTTPKALIVPHAGYVYSGMVAPTAYRCLRGAAHIRTVLLFGPAHRKLVAGMATTSAAAFATPLGSVPVDLGSVAEACQLPGVAIDDAAHRDEHCLEVQLPFLQMLLTDFEIVPFAVGHAREADVARVLARLWGGPETLIVITSDLSHYHADAEARALDAQAAEAIVSLAPERLDADQACGRAAIAGLLARCRETGLTAQTLRLANSSEQGGPIDRVVGYGAFSLG
jgi:AmmeMemoRadiSam system protein B